MHKPQILIGAASSGSGKTTFTLGLLRALKNRGMKVQPFKCGPDYLDTKHHAAAAGMESYNLDTFMASSSHIRDVYSRCGKDADLCITEGVMGLFDGYNQMQGSSAEIAETLGLPVLLVINARSTAYTVAAILYGFKHFRPETRVIGVIFNFVGSESHYEYLKQACRDAGVEALGYLPKCKNLEIPSRYLGLTIDSGFCFDEFADRIARQIEKTVHVGRLLEICCSDFSFLPPSSREKAPVSSFRIAVAQDEAFNFIYPENIRQLARLGEIIWFSPIHDSVLPESDFIYLPGGYPEFYLPQLSANSAMRKAIREYGEKGGRLLAECGGMMYLGESITDEKGRLYPMCGYLPQGATMENMRLHLGYRKVKINGQEYRGHEFHYSRILSGTQSIPTIGKVFNAKNAEIETPIYRMGNVTASYVHFYWGENGIGSLV